jgi:hypothetical protein
MTVPHPLACASEAPGRKGAALLQSFGAKSLKIGAKSSPARRARAFATAQLRSDFTKGCRNRRQAVKGSRQRPVLAVPSCDRYISARFSLT